MHKIITGYKIVMVQGIGITVLNNKNQGRHEYIKVKKEDFLVGVEFLEAAKQALVVAKSALVSSENFLDIYNEAIDIKNKNGDEDLCINRSEVVDGYKDTIAQYEEAMEMYHGFIVVCERIEVNLFEIADSV